MPAFNIASSCWSTSAFVFVDPNHHHRTMTRDSGDGDTNRSQRAFCVMSGASAGAAFLRTGQSRKPDWRCDLL
jgi:hypothetical protein